MRRTLFNVLLSVVAVIVFDPMLAFADSQKRYENAITALKSNDCATAVMELEQYKIEAAAELKADPQFAAQVDRQISLCRPPIAGGSVEMRGMSAPPDADRAQDFGRSIELRSF